MTYPGVNASRASRSISRNLTVSPSDHADNLTLSSSGTRLLTKSYRQELPSWAIARRISDRDLLLAATNVVVMVQG